MVDLEERTLEPVPERCEVCGVPLTADEQAAAREDGAPALCSIHADEVLALDPAELDEPA